LAVLFCAPALAGTHGKKKYPGGKYFIYRYTLKDKEGSPYSIDHPGRWLTHKSVERRRRQGLAVDSTDLPVSSKYLRLIEKTSAETVRHSQQRNAEWTIIGTSRWNNTVLVRSNDTTVFSSIATLPCVARAERVWESPDSIPKMVKQDYHDSFNAWDSIKGVAYGNGREQIEMVGGHRLHNIGMKGKGITIAVLDGGFQNADAIPAMQHANIIGAKDFVYPNSPYFYQETDHGTKVLSAMAVNEPEVLVGTAPDARYWLLRCEDQQSEQPVEEDYWAMAAEFADSVGVDIINSSLGYNDYDGDSAYYHQRDLDGRTALISRTASMLARKGIILVNSAGNRRHEPGEEERTVQRCGTHAGRSREARRDGPRQSGSPDIGARHRHQGHGHLVLHARHRRTGGLSLAGAPRQDGPGDHRPRAPDGQQLPRARQYLRLRPPEFLESLYDREPRKS